MANQEQLDILKKGVNVWNEWREEYPDIEIELLNADLNGAHLEDVDLSFAELSGAHLQGADLSFAKLNGAILIGAHLSDAQLEGAYLSGVTLSGAHLEGVNLTRANLRNVNFVRADLNGANLSATELTNTNFKSVIISQATITGAALWHTVFVDVDLSTVQGLETVHHIGPSSIGIDTIIRSQGRIPETFLRGAGVPNSIIEQIPALINSLKPIDFYSCFISYSSKNDDFARRLHTDLVENGVRCWFAPHDMGTGKVILKGIDEAIRQYDKLLLILTRHSVASNWVEHEVDMALFKEMQKQHQDVLFPIRLDNAILKSPSEWAKNICHRYIGDFTKWRNHVDYQKAFNRLLRDLKAEA